MLQKNKNFFSASWAESVSRPTLAPSPCASSKWARVFGVSHRSVTAPSVRPNLSRISSPKSPYPHVATASSGFRCCRSPSHRCCCLRATPPAHGASGCLVPLCGRVIPSLHCISVHARAATAAAPPRCQDKLLGDNPHAALTAGLC
jgi:hypothetical protein